MRKIYTLTATVAIILITVTICFLMLNSTKATELQKELDSWVGYKKLQEWTHIYETVFNKIVPDKLSIIILFDGKDKEDILMLVNHAKWEMPVLWDRNGAMNRHRKFPLQARMRCMLMDNENRVIAVGNPVYTRAVYDLYLKLLINKIEAI